MTIIIPSANATNLKQCIASIHKSDPGVRIVVIDDGARRQLRDTDGPYADLGVRWVPGVEPFVFARNINIGIREAMTDDVVLMNDDATVISGSLADMGREAIEDGYALVAASVVGTVCNPHQRPALCHCEAHDTVHAHAGTRPEEFMVAFICVFIPRATIDVIGALDEQFIGYGYDDNDYCHRVRDAGLKIGITNSCMVDHHSLRPTFRSRDDWMESMRDNERLYIAKRKCASQ